MRTAAQWTILLVLGLVGCTPAVTETPRIEGNELVKMLEDENVFFLDVREPSAPKPSLGAKGHTGERVPS